MESSADAPISNVDLPKKKSKDDIADPLDAFSKGLKHKRQKRRADGKCQSEGDKELSRTLSWALRHTAPSLGLEMSTDGYVRLDSLLSCGHRRFRKPWTVDDVRRVVENDGKQRYRLIRRHVGNADGEQALYIRANQGHSLPDVVNEDLLKPILPSELEQMGTIVHGTYRAPWAEHIRNEGLSKMRRNHIHFAAGMPNEGKKVISGMRSTCQIYIFVDGAKCAMDGVPFYRSDNGVILTPGASGGVLPPKYFLRVVDAETGDEVFDRETKRG